MSTGRRDFLKQGIAGAAGLTLVPSMFDIGAAAKDDKPKEEGKIVTRMLGKTGLELPIVSMGVMNADNPNLVRVALDSGIAHLDTAHYYSMGRNEQMLGEVLKEVPRDSYVIATKARASTVDRSTRKNTEDAKSETTESFIQKVDLSLERLGLDYVDILYLHSAKTKEDAVVEPIILAMQKLKEMGKIRFIGISTHRNEPEVIQAAIDSKVYEVVLTAYNFRMMHHALVKQAIANAAGAGLGVVAMKTQAGVYWDREKKKPINMKAALKWALQDENVHTSIPGFTNYDQLNDDLSVMEDLALSKDEKEDLKLGMNTEMQGLYCQQCGSCVAQCPQHLNIPTVMRSYMYAYGYRNLAAAKETFQSARVTESACAGCNICKIDCAMGFDIKNKVEDIARIQNVPDDFLL